MFISIEILEKVEQEFFKDGVTLDYPQFQEQTFSLANKKSLYSICLHYNGINLYIDDAH